ncbi:HU family DNA-binding protein [Pseudomonas sp. RIT-PI-S]|uniref:HU family DNA-binding protein n=1 Tax=Pseudomonas sp. RIT-PI-S TaxID=3035295 RepID=UPI0021D92FA8|nr:HU family DNA-binding protein [Pseudomonas sp. RIT-PI-S]
MHKNEVVDAIAERAAITRDTAKRVLTVVLEQITQAVDKENVTLVGFGTFVKRHRGGRKGKNPQTGEPIQIGASNTVAFKPGKNLRDSI